MSNSSHILVIDDEPDIRHLVQEILQDEGYDVACAEHAKAAQEHLQKRKPDLVLLDVWMPDMDGISLLKSWFDQGELLWEVIMMSGHGTIETAVEATRFGAYDFIEKPLSLAKLLLTVERALKSRRLTQENTDLKQQVERPSVPIGKSKIMHELREQFSRIAEHDTWVLITGEPGVGKSSFARHIHGQGQRASRPMIDVPMPMLSKERAARELLGEESGGEIYYGLLEQASGGVLFLGEVADIDLVTQGHLLHALEQSSFTRLGGNEPITVDVQVITASDYDLESLVAEGKFREDLYYRLKVVPLHVPPLRERLEDLPDLLSHYVNFFHQKDALPFREFTVAAQNYLRQYHWPGNVLELRNLVQRLLILGSEPEIDEVELASALPLSQKMPSISMEDNWYDLPLRDAREQFEKEYFAQQLKAVDGNMSRLSEKTGMERTNLYRKLRSLGLDPKQAGK